MFVSYEGTDVDRFAYDETIELLIQWFHTQWIALIKDKVSILTSLCRAVDIINVLWNCFMTATRLPTLHVVMTL